MKLFLLFIGMLILLFLGWLVILACLIVLFPKGDNTCLFWTSIIITGGSVCVGIFKA